MTTVVPVIPETGLKELITGGGPVKNLKPLRLADPPFVLTETAPVDPAPTTAVIVVGDTTEKATAGKGPKETVVAVVRSVPVIVTVPPFPTATGIKGEITGGAMKINPAFVPVPYGVDTEISPVAALSTTAVRVVGETTLKDAAGRPPKLTPVQPVKLLPVIVI